MPRARRCERMSTRKIEDERKQIDLFECWELKEDAAVGGFYDSEAIQRIDFGSLSWYVFHYGMF